MKKFFILLTLLFVVALSLVLSATAVSPGPALTSDNEVVTGVTWLANLISN